MTAITVVEPELRIVDPHHHLYPSNHWVDPSAPYLLQEFAADVGSGHNVVSTVYVECSQLFRETGPSQFRSAGEAEFAAVTGRMSDTGHFGPARICEAFVGTADLTRGAEVAEELDALICASDGRLSGIRFPTNWDPDPQINTSTRPFAPKGLMADASFREGVATLARYGLVYDAWQYYPQLGELAELADALPKVTFVAGHCGGLVGLRGYSGPENFDNWRACIAELAERQNVVMKLGGLAAGRTGFGFEARATRLTEDELIAIWRPYVETCIDHFGPDRCMFESNFPVDSIAADYATLWNVYKRIAAGYTAYEKAQMFSGVAHDIYQLP